MLLNVGLWWHGIQLKKFKKYKFWDPKFRLFLQVVSEQFYESLGDLKWSTYFNSSEKFMQIPLKIHKIYFLWHQAWPHNDLLLLKTKTWKLRFLMFIFLAIKMLKIPNFHVTLFEKKINGNEIFFVTSSIASKWPPT